MSSINSTGNTPAPDADGYVFTHEPDASRYILTRDGVLHGVLDYRDDGSTIAMVRAFTVPTFRGHGVAARVTAGAVADVRARGDRNIDAVCWYVAEWFEKNPDQADLLRVR